MNQKVAGRALIVVNIFAAAFLLFMLLRPTGLFGRPVVNWWATRQAARYARAHWSEILSGANVLGTGQRVSIVLFADYECPFCRREHETVAEWLKARPSVAIAVRNYPLPFHPHAFAGAVAAVCAARAGRFAAMDDVLYTTTSWMEHHDWGNVARQAGIRDTAEFKACIASDAANAAVARDMAMGAKLHITGTPTFLNRDAMMPGSVPVNMLDSLIAGPRPAGRENR